MMTALALDSKKLSDSAKGCSAPQSGTRVKQFPKVALPLLPPNTLLPIVTFTPLLVTLILISETL